MTAQAQQAYIELVSGRRRGLVAGLLRAGLSVLSVGYMAGITVRNAWYRLAPRAAKRVGRPVLSIGNLTTGGTGKTPLTAWLANQLAERGLRVGILLRGYRGRPVRFADENREDAASQWRVESDEAMLLTRLCPKAEVIVDPDRVAGAARAVSRGVDVLLLDDGFQHRRLARDLDIVLVDATCAFGFGRGLPRGLLREPIWSLRRADVIVLTRSDLVDDEKRRRLVEALGKLSGGRPVIQSRHAIVGFADLKGRPVADVDVGAMQAVVFAGLGNFEPFRESVRRLGATVTAAYQYPDHHDYSDEEISQLGEVAERVDANVLVTTEKDAVKLVGRWGSGPTPLLAARLEMAFDDSGAEALMAAVLRALGVDRRENETQKR